jgi:hypothetical protein
VIPSLRSYCKEHPEHAAFCELMRELGERNSPGRGLRGAEPVWILCVSKLLEDEDIPETASPSERVERAIALTIQFVMASPRGSGG